MKKTTPSPLPNENRDFVSLNILHPNTYYQYIIYLFNIFLEISYKFI